MPEQTLSTQTLQRLPRYLNYLHSLSADATQVSATQIAEAVGLGDVQVRKDLALVSGRGRPKTGYNTRRLTADIQRLLYCGAVRFCIVGAGPLGQALAQHPGFAEYGLELAALFDTGGRPAAHKVEGVSVRPLADLPAVCRKEGIQVGVITTPPAQAQAACDALARAGVGAIWNFAPIHLAAPGEVCLEHENMAARLGMLSRRLQQRLDNAVL